MSATAKDDNGPVVRAFVGGWRRVPRSLTMAHGRELEADGIAVYIAIKARSFDGLSADATLDQLTEDLPIRRATVSQKIRQLEALGYFTVERVGHRSVYRFTDSAISSQAEPNSVPGRNRNSSQAEPNSVPGRNRAYRGETFLETVSEGGGRPPMGEERNGHVHSEPSNDPSMRLAHLWCATFVGNYPATERDPAAVAPIIAEALRVKETTVEAIRTEIEREGRNRNELLSHMLKRLKKGNHHGRSGKRCTS